MARIRASLLLSLSGLLLAAAPVLADDARGTSDQGHRNAGESSDTWGGVPFYVWIIGVVALFIGLFAFLYFTTRGRPQRSSAPPAPAPERSAAPVDQGPARDLAIATFPHINGAEQAFAAAQEHDRDAVWLRETTFVEAHRHHRLVVRGTFAGHYLSVDDVRDPSPYGAIARAVVGAAFDDLETEVPEGSSALLVFGSADALDLMTSELDGDRVVRRHISDEDADALSRAAAQAPLAAPPR
jgi:hypothetical protein